MKNCQQTGFTMWILFLLFLRKIFNSSGSFVFTIINIYGSGQILLSVGVGLLALSGSGHAQTLPNQLVSPPPLGVGLFSMVQKLQAQLLRLEQLHDQDRHRLKRLERRNREYSKSAMTSSEEIVQLKQHVLEMQEKMATSEEVNGNINLEISRLDYEQKRIKEQIQMLKLKHSADREETHHTQWNSSQTFSFQNISETFENIVSDIEILKEKQLSQISQLEKNSAECKQVKQVLKFHLRDRHSSKPQQNNVSNHLNTSNNQSVLTSSDFISGDGESGDTEYSDPEEFLFWTEIGSGRLDNISMETESLDDVPNWLKLKVIVLEEKFQELEEKVSEKLDAEAENDLVQVMKNLLQTHDVYFEKEILKRDSQIETLEAHLAKLAGKMTDVEKRVLSIQLGDFMQKLQESMINFTQHVITVDQWNIASNQIINSTQYNQHQIMELTAMIMNNSKSVNQMEWKVVEQRSLSDQQFRVLRMHIIRLNNTLQDLREHVDYLGTIKTKTHLQKDENFSAAASSDMMTKLEELALQIVYNENRLGKLENKVLNQSLMDCKKVNTDLFQDSKLHRVDQELSKFKHKVNMMDEMIKRVDRSLYRIHANTKNNTHFINKLSSMVATWEGYFPVMQLLRQEVDHLLSQVPTDCQEYYERGYHKSGTYIIFPRGSPQSLSVQCQMDKDGAWTVIQRRMDGSENFARSWTEYAVGFGKTNGEYWLGNEFLNYLTSTKNYSLKIEMVDIFNEHWLVEYKEFAVSPKEDSYKLYIYGFSGNATDSMDYSDGVPFSTQDRDNDLSSTHCASYFTAGWWYRHCQYSNLNGRYDSGIVWFNYDWQDWIQMKSVRMMIKPVT